MNDIMTKEHKKITGEELTENSVCYCEQFDNGGMSHGFISGMFRVKKAFLILEERLNKLQKNIN